MMRADAGTVFVDTLIAAVVVSLSLGMMYRAVADAARHEGALADRRAALMIAQSELAAVGAELPLAPGATRGVQGPFTWRVDIVPASGAGSSAGRLWAVTVSVGSTGAANTVTLKSLRLGPEG